VSSWGGEAEKCLERGQSQEVCGQPRAGVSPGGFEGLGLQVSGVLGSNCLPPSFLPSEVISHGGLWLEAAERQVFLGQLLNL
jgi:hypothetical protein